MLNESLLEFDMFFFLLTLHRPLHFFLLQTLPRPALLYTHID